MPTPLREAMSNAVHYRAPLESPIHRVRKEFLERMPDPTKALQCLEVTDEMVALLAVLDSEEAQQLIRLVRDLLDTVEPRIRERT